MELRAQVSLSCKETLLQLQGDINHLLWPINACHDWQADTYRYPLCSAKSKIPVPPGPRISPTLTLNGLILILDGWIIVSLGIETNLFWLISVPCVVFCSLGDWILLTFAAWVLLILQVPKICWFTSNQPQSPSPKDRELSHVSIVHIAVRR